MTEFVDKYGDCITTKNNMNNVQVGHDIEVNDGTKTFYGQVEKVTHVVSVWHNKEGLERSTHDLVINIK